jgi:hypothetical protein
MTKNRFPEAPGELHLLKNAFFHKKVPYGGSRRPVFVVFRALFDQKGVKNGVDQNRFSRNPGFSGFSGEAQKRGFFRVFRVFPKYRIIAYL